MRSGAFSMCVQLSCPDPVYSYKKACQAYGTDRLQKIFSKWSRILILHIIATYKSNVMLRSAHITNLFVWKLSLIYFSLICSQQTVLFIYFNPFSIIEHLCVFYAWPTRQQSIFLYNRHRRRTFTHEGANAHIFEILGYSSQHHRPLPFCSRIEYPPP